MNIHDTIPFMTVGLPDDIRRHQLAGNFAEALRLIDLRLSQNNLPDCLRNSLIAHREMIDRLAVEFPYTREEALAIVQKKIPEFTMEELQEQMDLRNVHYIYMNGEIRIFGRFDETLFSVVDEVYNRVPPKDPNAPAPINCTDHAMGIMKEKGFSGGKVRIAHCFNEESAIEIERRILSDFPDCDISVGLCGALCSFYAEKGGLLLSYEGSSRSK